MAQEEKQDLEVLSDLPGINNDNSLRINKGIISNTFHVAPLSYPEFGQMVYVDELDTLGIGFISINHGPRLSEMRARNPELFKMYHQKRAHVTVIAEITSSIQHVGQLALFWTPRQVAPLGPNTNLPLDDARFVSCTPPSQVVWADLGGSFTMELTIPWMVPKHCIDQTDETGAPYTDAQLDIHYAFPTAFLVSIGSVFAPADFTPWSVRWAEQWHIETGAPTMSSFASV